MRNAILIFGAHHDDELAMAGTIARLARQGCDVHLAVLTDGCEGYPAPGLRASIVAARKREAAECDRILGIRERVALDRPDMGLVCDKATLQECIRLVRRVRPRAIFGHGPADAHTDHRAAHRLGVDACWHAGEPVSAALGEPWKTPVFFYYRGMGPGGPALPMVALDVTELAYKRLEAQAAQKSQFSLWATTPDAVLARAAALRERPEPARETFWVAEGNVFDSFPFLSLETPGKERG